MIQTTLSVPWPARTAEAVIVASAGMTMTRTSSAAIAKMTRYVSGESVTSAVRESMSPVAQVKMSVSSSIGER